MSQIGQFMRTQNGYFGRIRTLSLDLDIAIVDADASDAENAPDYRVHVGSEDGPAIGAGWRRSGEKAGEFVALQLDDPTFAQPIRANLFQSSDDNSAWSLQWSRPRARNQKD